jgi:hypothetical protein
MPKYLAYCFLNSKCRSTTYNVKEHCSLKLHGKLITLATQSPKFQVRLTQPHLIHNYSLVSSFSLPSLLLFPPFLTLFLPSPSLVPPALLLSLFLADQQIGNLWKLSLNP